jgi:putative ATP-binding cassette transporter
VPFTNSHPLFGRRFARNLFKLTRLYWSSSDAKRGGLLLAVTISLEMGTVYGNVLLSGAQRGIFDAFQNRDINAFSVSLGTFLALTLGFLLVSTYRVYTRQALEVRWRQWLTDHYLERWIGSEAYCEMELHRKATDNPDQRIAEDVRDYVASALGLSLSLLSAIASLVSFAGILWSLSGSWTFEVAGTPFRIPGLMMWVAIVYATVATLLTHRVGRSLIPIQYDRQRFEADFRYTLVRFREHVEAVALAGGEDGERRSAMNRFRRVVDNYWRLIRAQRNLTLFTTGIGQSNSIVPYVIAAPGFFAGTLSLGSVVQTNIAYGQVSGSLVWFVNAYQEIANWRASVERLVTFDAEIESTCAATAGLRVDRGDGSELRLENVHLTRPDGEPMVGQASGVIRRGEHVALLGPMGSGKSTLLRAIAGVWHYGRGRISMPEDARTFFQPQRPYLPIGTLREVASYPSPGDSFPDDAIREALQQVGLGDLADRLDESANWEQQLSTSEEQRLAFARVLLQKPDWIFLDKATSALDEASAQQLHARLQQLLPNASIVSIADREGVVKDHERSWTLVPGPEGSMLQAA